jgi:hypothetical protein
MNIKMTINEQLNIWDMVDKIGFPFRLTRSYDKSGRDRGKGWYVNWCDDGHCLCAHSGDAECPKGNEVWADTPYKAVKIALQMKLLTDQPNRED